MANMTPSKLLLRQLKRAFNLGTEEQFSNFVARLRHYDTSVFPRDVGVILKEFEHFLEYIDQTYAQHERDMDLRTRSLDLTSQELLVRNEELQSYSHAVSHDLRVPLRAINGHAGQLNEQLADHPAAQGNLQKVLEASEQMEQMLADLLNLAAHKQEIRKESCDASALANQIGMQLQVAHPQDQVQLVIEADIQVEADPLHFREVLQNLLSNAWKFSRTQPNATIEFGQLVERSPTTYFVRDNGVGFPAEDAERLFQPFQRLHADNAAFDGYGIGLATANRVIRRHGGRIWAENNATGGACFYFTLMP